MENDHSLLERHSAPGSWVEIWQEGKKLAKDQGVPMPQNMRVSPAVVFTEVMTSLGDALAKP